MPVNTLMPEPVVDVIHGVTVSDPYRWLEDRNSPATEEWIRDQQKRHDDYFSGMPDLHRIRQRVSDYLNLETTDQPGKVGDRYFFRRRAKNQEQACLWTRNALSGEERLLVDPSAQGSFAAVSLHRIFDDGSLLAYELRHGGSDAKEIHILDVERAEILPDHLETGYARGLAFAPDKTGFYYCHELPGSAGPHTIGFHRFGEPTCADEIIFAASRKSHSRLILLSDDSRLGALTILRGEANTCIDFQVASRCPNSTWQSVLTGKVLNSIPFLADGRIFLLTEDGAPRRRIVELAETGEIISEVVPEREQEIQQYARIEQHLLVVYKVDRTTLVHRWTLDGEYLDALPLPTGGTIDFLPNVGRSSTVFYNYESFTEAPAIFEYDDTSQVSSSWRRTVPSQRTSQVRVTETSYPSKDGTLIPMSLVMRSDVKCAETRPVILTAYGGFGAIMTPRFSTLVSLMVESGAIFALPNIRGGGEFGKAWHEAGKASNRQTAFDDFIAAAEYLCAENLTTPQQLGIFGGSNSGLLVSVALTQRPDLFRAALCIAPLLDMVRYERFDQARKWRQEYGTAAEPDGFKSLHAYSPYHHVELGINYPSILFVSGDHDDRCNPAHVRKMAAMLQNRPSQNRPVLVDYSIERGHSAALPLSVRVDALARRIAFLCRELQMSAPN